MKGEKLIASILTAIMTLATFVSPVLAAVDLGDYPSFLFKDHNLDAYVVVGASAQTADVVGAIDLAVRLAGESYEEVSVAGGTSLSGAASEEIALGDTIAGGSYLDTSLKHYKISGLKDDSITFQDDTYDYHEEIGLSSTANTLDVESSLTSSDDDYGSGVYLEVAKSALMYYFVFDDAINISKATSDDPLEIEFLGRALKVTSVTDSDTLTAQVGDEYSLNVGDSVTVLGKAVKLLNVGSSGSVVVDVDGVSGTISQGSTKTVNGVKIKPTDYFYADAKEERMATIVVGEETSKTYNNGDPYIGEDKDNPDWVWNLGSLTLTGSSITLGIKNDFVKDDYSDDPVTVDGCYEYPNDYAKVCLDSLTVDSYQTYEFKADTGVDLSDADLSYGSSNNVLTIRSPGEDEGLQIPGSLNSNTPKTDTVYLKTNSTGAGYVQVFYVDNNNNVNFAGALALSGPTSKPVANITYQDTKGIDMSIEVAGNTDTTNNTLVVLVKNHVIATNDNLNMTWTTSSGAVAYLGSSDNDADATELKWASTNIGTKEKDLRTIYGVVIKVPNTNGASDKVVLEVPADQVKAKVVVYGPGGTSTTTEGESVKKVVPITSAVAKLDTEISDPATVGKHLVLVGGPCVNSLVAALADAGKFDYTCTLWPGENFGMVEVVEGGFATAKDVVVVAGTRADDTRMATSLLQRYTEFADELSGNTAVKVTSLSAAGITPV